MLYEDYGENDSIIDQCNTEEEILKCREKQGELLTNELLDNLHENFILKAYEGLPDYFVGLDASQSWLCYWGIHGLDLLGYPEKNDKVWENTICKRVVASISRFQHPEGGFGGGPGQLAHLASSYACILSLAIVGTPEAYSIIDREKMYSWLMRMKKSDGSFTMHEGGEIDVRGVYCAFVIANLCGIMTEELTINSASFVGSCQTYEGGMGSLPGLEAHGGYTYCALAALHLIDRMDVINLHKLSNFCRSRQMPIEGGFSGRTNKLVDGCYSFWLGGIFPILEHYLPSDGNHLCCYDRDRLQSYIYECCQNVKEGGLRDKPSKKPDLYHTCYCLSGLSISQNRYKLLDGLKVSVEEYSSTSTNSSKRLRATHPVFNVLPEKVDRMIKYFTSE